MTRRPRRRQHGNPFHIRGDVAVPDWSMVYGRAAPFAVDVGFGGGAFLLDLARAHPEWNVLGLEIRQFLVTEVLEAARVAGVHNLHALIANANQHLEALLPDGSAAFVSVNFPDPWFKKRHHKRRVVRSDWLDVVARKLRPEGELHYASDEPGAREALELVQAHPGFVAPAGFSAASTTGILTERERTHTRRGEPIFRFAARRAEVVPAATRD